MGDLPDRYCEATLRLNILVVGCGLGGIAAAYRFSRAGHTVTILEAAHEIKAIGLGITLAPNVIRLLARWGAQDALRAHGAAYGGALYLKHDTGQKLAFLDASKAGEASRPGGRDEDGLLPTDAPDVPLCLNFHRAELHKILYDLAFSSPLVSIRLNSRVVSVNPDPSGENSQVSVTLASGEIVHGDLVVGADGIKSVTRQAVLEHTYATEPTGDSMFRAVIPAGPMREDPVLRELFDKPNVMIWIGKHTHVVGYPISAGREYNFAIIYPDNGAFDAAKDTQLAQMKVMNLVDEFKEYEPRVQKIISLVEQPLRWQLMAGKPIESWMHPAGRAVLLGDAAHPMLPLLGQGAGMAIEDSAVLGRLLAKISDISQLPQLLRAYDQLRIPRVSEVQKKSNKMRHLEIDVDKDEESMNPPVKGDSLNGISNAPGNSKKVRPLSHEKAIELYSYDAEADVDSWWNENAESVFERI